MMSKRVFVLFLMLTFVTGEVLATGKPVDVYLLAGQSNMQGYGHIEAIPEADRTVSGVMFYYSFVVKGGLPFVLHDTVTAAGARADCFGPELGFAKRIKELRPGTEIALIKYAVGGTSLAANWKPGASADDRANWGPQFAGFVDTVQKGIKALHLSGYEPRIVGMLWVQGEQDAKNGLDYNKNPPVAIPGERDAALNYAKNLTQFISRVREQFADDTAADGLRVVLATVLSYAPAGGDIIRRFVARDIVIAAQLAVDEKSQSLLAIPNVRTVRCDEKNTPANAQIKDGWRDAEEVHLSAEGLFWLGKRMADQMVGMP